MKVCLITILGLNEVILTHSDFLSKNLCQKLNVNGDDVFRFRWAWRY
ncbi:MAG: hypothetical protein RLZ35_183, partial [Pseudomonadota bacterium]